MKQHDPWKETRDLAVSASATLEQLDHRMQELERRLTDLEQSRLRFLIMIAGLGFAGGGIGSWIGGLL